VNVDALSVPCPLRAAALSAPEAAAIIGLQGAITYDELDSAVSATAFQLRVLEPGSRVALYLPRDERYVTLMLAVIRAGHVACPVSDRTPWKGVAQLLERAACAALISDDDRALPSTGAGLYRWKPGPLLEDRQGGEPADIHLDQPATIVFTSGSTGTPKAALHTFGNHYSNALGSNANITLRPGDRWLHSLPLYHVGGISILFRCLLAGATIALPGHWTPIGESIADLGATHVSLVSTQLLRLLREDTDLGRLKAVLMGGGPVSASLVEEAMSRGLPIHTSYGLTEMASQVTTTPPYASPEELYTSGRVLRGREISTSEEGEILVRGETLFAGYVEGGTLDLPLDKDGWFHTGDLGELDENGSLHVLGRRDNLFISGGENIQPEEIEEVLCRLDSIHEAVVVPVPDPEFGLRPVAFIRTAGNEPGDLARKLREFLPGFKIPTAFHPWPGNTQRGIKPDRNALRQRARRLRDHT
jgi:o-succinylbenzoate---CoA ligase